MGWGGGGDGGNKKTQFCVRGVIAMVSSWHAGNVMGMKSDSRLCFGPEEDK